MSVSVSMNGDLSDATSNIRVSGLHISSSFCRTDPVREMGTETMTASAHFASSRTRPFPDEGSMTSTRWPAPFKRSANQRPILPYPPTMAMWRILEVVLGSAAWISMDSCMRILQIFSAYTGFIPFSRANPRYLSMTLFS